MFVDISGEKKINSRVCPLRPHESQDENGRLMEARDLTSTE